jgi:hypothetical protein
VKLRTLKNIHLKMVRSGKQQKLSNNNKNATTSKKHLLLISDGEKKKRKTIFPIPAKKHLSTTTAIGEMQQENQI